MTDDQSPRQRFADGMRRRAKSLKPKHTLKKIIAENLDLIDGFKAENRTSDEIAAELGEAYCTTINVRSFETTLSSLRDKPRKNQIPKSSAITYAPPNQALVLRHQPKTTLSSSIEPIRQDDPDI